MRGFTLLELIIVITIMGMLTLVVLPVLQRSLFGEKDMLKAFILKNVYIATKTNQRVELFGNGKRITSSLDQNIDLPLEGRCEIYPNGDIKQCYFGKGGRFVYYTVFDF